MQLCVDDVVHIGFADKAACNLSTGNFFQQVGRAAADFGKVCITGKAARNGLLATLSLNHRAKPKARYTAIFHMGAKQVQRSKLAGKQLVQYAHIVNIRYAAFAQMPYKAACVVKSFYVGKIGNSTVLHAAVHHAAAKAACAASVAGFALRSFLAAAVRLYGQTALNACNLGIINISTECVQHRGVAQLNQAAEQLCLGAVRIFAGNLCHTGYIGQTEEATGILAAVYTAQILYLYPFSVRVLFAHRTGFQRTRKATCVGGILYGVTIFIRAIYHKAPCIVCGRNCCRMNGSGSSLQHFD